MSSPINGGGNNNYVNPNQSPFVDPGQGQMLPTGPPLPPNSPWVAMTQKLFPNLSLPEAQMYASSIQKSFFQALQDQISSDDKRRQEEKQREQEMQNDSS